MVDSIESFPDFAFVCFVAFFLFLLCIVLIIEIFALRAIIKQKENEVIELCRVINKSDDPILKMNCYFMNRKIKNEIPLSL